MKVFARFINSIFPDRCRHVIGYFFKRIHCISHRHADAGFLHNLNIIHAVAKCHCIGEIFFFSKIHRQPAESVRLGIAFLDHIRAMSARKHRQFQGRKFPFHLLHLFTAADKRQCPDRHREHLPRILELPPAASPEADIISRNDLRMDIVIFIPHRHADSESLFIAETQHPAQLRQIISFGLPSGLQNSIISIANIVVQSNINKFGVMAVAGCGVYSKIEGFAFLPITCFAMALTTFIGQNLGARQYDRAKKGAAFGIVCSMTLAELVGVIVYMLIPYLAAAFDSSAEVVGFATRQAHVEALFYCFLAFSHCIAGIMRGAGKSAVPMFVMLVSWCIIRITYITITVHFIPKIQVIFWAYPLTWSISSIIFLVYFLKADWIHNFERAEQR